MTTIVKPAPKTTHFTSDGQLLSELGERLIGSPQVALAELVKNAYDADSTKANIWVEGKKLYVKDNGHGMTETEFLDFWMTIATASKLRSHSSRIYGRPVTGSKGVGRFAVRFLGRTLVLETVAKDQGTGEWTKLSATFNWDEFKAGTGLDKVPIKYTLEPGYSKDDVGTTLRIERLQHVWDKSALQRVTGQVLDIISPPFGPLEVEIQPKKKKDPGFALYFTRPGEEDTEEHASAEVVDRYLARAFISVEGRSVTYEYEYDGEKDRKFTWKLPENLIGNLTGEIRYYPRRPGIFTGMETMDGREAVRWLRVNGGVRVIDRGFRLLPYGQPDDDWLQLSAAKATNVREWGSDIAKKLYPEEKRIKEEREDPLLKVPANHQLLGAVYVESSRPPASTKTTEVQLRTLQPTMDRQGFVFNDGFRQLREVVRGAIDLMAVVDVEATAERKKKEAKIETLAAKREIRQAIQRTRTNKQIAPADKKAIIESYERIANQVDRMQEAHKEARRALETMSLLGVLAGFMTHEATVMLRAVERMLDKWRKVPKHLRDDDFNEMLKSTEEALSQIHGHLDYSRTFLGNLKDADPKPFHVRPQVDLVAEQFEKFRKARRIEIENKVPASLKSPPILLSVYTGVLLNLLSNALKAIVAHSGANTPRIVRIEAMETDKGHILRVSDTGIGIPPEIQERIFDPLFSTTTGDGPLSSGMGLGLHIVERLIDEIGGEIYLATPPEGFSTCFEVLLPDE